MSTIRDVARLAKVSTATVSRVINNDPTYKMREETRDRVWRAVAEAGYKTPAIKAELAARPPAGHVKVGCILSVTKDKYKDPYFMSVFSGIEEGLAQKGFSLDFLKTQHELHDKETLRSLFIEPPAGVILMETLEPATYRYVRARVKTCVGVDTLHGDIDNVGYDQFETASRVMRFLLSRGHRDIAFIGGSGPSGDLFDNKRYLGYFITLTAAGLPVRPEWMYNCQWDEELCIAQVKEMMTHKKRPTAIFAASDLMAIAALSALYSAEIKVPDEVAVMGISDIELARFSSPPLTTYAVPARELGLQAANLLEKRLAGDDMLPQRVYLPTKRVLRASV